jgi:hypothetical protein
VAQIPATADGRHEEDDMRRLLIAMGIAMAALEAIDAPTLGEMWPIAAAFAVMFAGLTWWFAARGTFPPIVLLGILFLLEVVSVPGYERTTAMDWLLQGLAGALSLAGLIAAIGAFVLRRRSVRAAAVVGASVA